jgi:hypothetical protein
MKKITTVLFISLVACTVTFSQSAQMSGTRSATPEDFSIFQSQFFSDSLFQAARITFPLDFSKPDSYPKKIERRDWKFNSHLYWNPTDPTDIHNKIVEIYPGATKTVVKGRLDSGGYENYNFDLINGKWFLVKLEIPDL